MSAQVVLPICSCANQKHNQRTRYLNAVNTLQELLCMGVIPIVNENDTVSVSVRRAFDLTSMGNLAYRFCCRK